MTWTYQPLTGDDIPPRSGFSMKAIDNKIIIFGGDQEGTYLSWNEYFQEWEGKKKCFDVWIIDTEKFNVKRIPTTYICKLNLILLEELSKQLWILEL